MPLAVIEYLRRPNLETQPFPDHFTMRDKRTRPKTMATNMLAF